MSDVDTPLTELMDSVRELMDSVRELIRLNKALAATTATQNAIISTLRRDEKHRLANEAQTPRRRFWGRR